MKFSELEAQVRSILPHAQLEEDNDGQIIVYTNLHEVDGEIVDNDE